MSKLYPSNKHFETYEEAEEFKKKLGLTPDWMCPLSGNSCRDDCVCFVGAEIEEVGYFNTKPTRHRVISSYCDNVMFKGRVRL